MAKWETCIFKMKLNDGGTKTACGPAYKGLCLVREKKGRWRLMHMRSGVGVTSLSGDYHAIRRISVDIANLMDWDTFTTSEDIVAVPGLDKRIDAIVRSAIGEDLMEAGNA